MQVSDKKFSANGPIITMVQYLVRKQRAIVHDSKYLRWKSPVSSSTKRPPKELSVDAVAAAMVAKRSKAWFIFPKMALE